MNQLQEKQFELLGCFVRLCEKLQIPYFLVCGSALGAVKYGGFIPWDDDVDVALLRSDYDRFLREAPAHLPEGLFLQTFCSDPAYPHIFAKLRDSRTAFVEREVAHLPMNHGIFIDVFPLDGYPTDKREQKRLERRKGLYKRLLLSVFNGNYRLRTRMAVKIMRLFGVHKRTNRILAKYERVISAYDPATSAVLCNHGNWQGKLEYAPREQYGEGRSASFEGMTVRIPAEAEAYLTQKYGDFRADLPVGEQKGHHVCSVMDLDMPYEEAMGRTSKRKLQCLVHYDLPHRGEARVCHPAAYTKSNYMFHCFRRLGLDLHILSASMTNGPNSVSGRMEQTDEGAVLELLPCGGRHGHVRNACTRLFFQLRLLSRLKELVQDGDTLWVYHSLGLTWALNRLKRCRRFRLILEVEELYGDAWQSPRISRREVRYARIADTYIFPSEELNRRVNLQGKPYAITHGTYRLSDSECRPASDGIIHVVYAGTLEPVKGGVYAAIDAAKYLPGNYHVHILGTGTDEHLRRMREKLDAVSAESVCRLTYDGVLYDKAYTDFLHSCHIGLSTQDPAGDFNATSFPSKVLSYMASGLRVVSARIPVVENSLVGDCLYYYGEQSPEAIAAAIQRVDLSDGYDGKAVLRRLDEEFLGDLKKMIFEGAW